ncbi:MAG TPA: cobalamin-dependent protein, partial [Vicinamibacterales bacterium]|nr:cobalamin-dependent protein [Vicinamibacterales bacterium]
MILLYNPLSTTPGKQPLPLSLMSLAAVLELREEWCLVDGNLERDPSAAIVERLRRAPRSDRSLVAVTVMPGPQLTQAVDVCRRVKSALPHVPIVWGGYFPTQHADTVLQSSFVDFVIRSQGEGPLLQLVDALRQRTSLDRVGSLSWKAGAHVIHNAQAPTTALDDLPDLPYHRVDMSRYLHRNYLGRRTVAHSSSFGCPFACSFCAVVSMSNRRWLAQSPARLERVVRHLATTYRVDAVQMHDMDFFISEDRTAEFCDRIADLHLRWWALGRVDVLMQYRDATWQKMARSGLAMVFSGAESGTDE